MCVCVQALEKFWVSTIQHHDTDGSKCLDKDEYRLVHKRLVGAFNESEHDHHHEIDDAEAEQSLEEDWEQDSGGAGVVERTVRAQVFRYISTTSFDTLRSSCSTCWTVCSRWPTPGATPLTSRSTLIT